MLDLEAIKERLEGPGMGHLIEDVHALLEEVEQLREAAGSTYCAYCGERFPLDAPDAADDVSLHISVCEKHPMRQAEAEILRLDALATRLRVACQFAIDFLNEVDSYNAGKGQATPETVLELRGTLRRAIGGA